MEKRMSDDCDGINMTQWSIAKRVIEKIKKTLAYICNL